jgi:L-ascorbate metabolism protein UlaG (beta-lactamase superfamily)
MQIIWKGQSNFQIIASRGKGGEVKIVIDPFDPEIGLKPASTEADILLVTHNHKDHNNVQSVKGSPFLIEGPGEYDIKDVFIQGISAFHDKSQGKERGSITIYTIEAEDLRLCHLGDLGQKELTSDQLEEIGEVDILMIPVGGIFTIDAVDAARIISQIEPKIVIPMHYLIPKLKIKLDSLDKFLKVMGHKTIEPQNKLIVKKKDLLEEEMRIVVLEP